MERAPVTAGDVHDCAIVGGGPAGLTTALYLRRFHRSIVLLDAGDSRARWIPESHNCPGFPGGISGKAFLQRLGEQAADYGVHVVRTHVDAVEREDGGFVLRDEHRRWRARTAVLATGVVDVLPDEPWIGEAIERAAVRLCPICDGYEAGGGALAAYGPIDEAIAHACFLRTFSASVHALGLDDREPGEDARRRAQGAGVVPVRGPCRLSWDGTACSAIAADGEPRRFDAFYPVMGSRIQSGLAVAMGAKVDADGALVVSRQQMTSVEGLYAIGDVVSAVDQIAVALGHAAVAATAIHNALPPNRARAGREAASLGA